MSAHARLTQTDVLLSATWAAMVTSAGELVAIGLEKYGLGKLVHHAGSHLLWMIPTANIVLFAIVAALLLGLARVWPKLLTPRSAGSVFAALAALALLIIVRRHLHDAAIMLMAAGVGVQVGYLAERHERLFRRIIGWSLTPALAVLVLGAVALPLTAVLAERKGIERLGAAPEGARNILLIILDTVRSPSLTASGQGASASLEALAARGVSFDFATAPGSWTLPSHASVFTGRPAHELPEFWQRPLNDSVPVLAEELRKRGYLTAGFTANPIVSHESGLSRGFLHYESVPHSLAQVFNSSSILRALHRSPLLDVLTHFYDLPARKDALDVNASFFHWLEEAGDRPYFAFLNYFDAHAPYLPPATCDEHTRSDASRRPLLSEQLNIEAGDAASVEAELTAYERAASCLQLRVSALVRRLERDGRMRNTIVIVTSDHGEEFGEHGSFGHGNTVYREIVHVPLVIIGPGVVPAGQRVEEPVTLADLPATIFDLALGGEAILPGVSLRETWQSNVNGGVRLARSDESGTVSLMTRRHHYIRWPDGREELFDLADDPMETRDLSASDAVGSVLEEFRRGLGNAGMQAAR